MAFKLLLNDALKFNFGAFVRAEVLFAEVGKLGSLHRDNGISGYRGKYASRIYINIHIHILVYIY